jgi:hypothetical protein
MDGSFVTMLSTPLMLPASVAGALAVLFVVLAVLAVRRAGAGATRLGLPIAAMAIGGLSVVAVLDRLAVNERAAERQAIGQRETALTAFALAPGSALGCLDSVAGEKVESSCENAVFADPQSVAGAVSYVSARLALLNDGLDFARRADPGFAETLSALRRAIELDRFGIAAHVLSSRDGCTAERCPAFVLLRDASALKANLRVGAYNAYVTRHVAAWISGTPAGEKQPPVASVPSAVEPALASASPPASAPAVGIPVPSRYDFPSAASIPPVSIMNAEPPLPPGASTANAAAPPAASPPAPAAASKVPVPPRRPPIEPTPPPAPQ